MAILNVFKQKWRHSDPEKRKEAIESGLEIQHLIKMAETDPDPAVQTLARAHVERLYERMEPDRRQIIAAKMAAIAPDLETKKKYIRRLTDPSLIKELKTELKDQSLDQLLNERLARCASGEDRLKAIQQMTEVPVLTALLQSATDSGVREYLLAQIAVHARIGIESERKLKAEAHEALQDNEAIVYVITHRDHYHYKEGRSMLVKKLTDLQVLKDLALASEDDTPVLEATVDKLVSMLDPEHLARFAIETAQTDRKNLNGQLFKACLRHLKKEMIEYYGSKDTGFFGYLGPVEKQYIGEAIAETLTQGKIKALELLLNAGLSPNRDNLLAGAVKDINMVRMLLERGANPNPTGDYLERPLFAAVKNGDYEIVSLLLKHGAAKSINARDQKLPLVENRDWVKGTALHCACLLGRKDLVRLLLDHGADPEITASGNKKTKNLTQDQGIILTLEGYDQRKNRT